MKYGVSFKTKTTLSNYFSKQSSKDYPSQKIKGNITINGKDRLEMPIQSVFQSKTKSNTKAKATPNYKTTQNSPDRFSKNFNRTRDLSEASYEKGEPQPAVKAKGKEMIKFDQLFLNKIHQMHTKNTQSYHQLTHSSCINHILNKTSLENSHQQKGLLYTRKPKVAAYKRCNSTFEEEKEHSVKKSLNGLKYNASNDSHSKKNSPRLFSANVRRDGANNGSKPNSKPKTNQKHKSTLMDNFIQSINIKDFQSLNRKGNSKKANRTSNYHTNNNTKSNKHLYVKYSSVLSKAYAPLKIQSSTGAIPLECSHPHTKSIKNISLDLFGKAYTHTKPNSRLPSKEKTTDKMNKEKSNPLIQSLELNSFVIAKKAKNSLASTKCSSSSLIKQNERFNNSPLSKNHEHLIGLTGVNDNGNANAKKSNNSSHQHNSSQFAATSKHFLNLNDIQIIEAVTFNEQSNGALKNQKGIRQDNSKEELLCGEMRVIDPKDRPTVSKKCIEKPNSLIKELTENSKASNASKVTKNAMAVNGIKHNPKQSGNKVNSILNAYQTNPLSKYKAKGAVMTKYNILTQNHSPVSQSNPALNNFFNRKHELQERAYNNIDNSPDEERTEEARLNLKAEERKHKATDNNLIEQIMTEANQSIQSTIRESAYYQLEMEKIAYFIRQYHSSKGCYPESKISFYKYGRLIGKGAFGKVNLALHIASGRLVAVKSFNKSRLKNSREKDKIKHEINALRKLQHPFISKILDTFETEKHILICMEYICGDLLSFIRKRSKLSEPSAKVIFKQIIEGLEFIHSNKIVHRDIKLDNILIDLNNTVKICDFGVSRKLNPGDVMHEHCGTLAYIAPEIFKDEGYEGYTCDIWSAGVTLYYMLSGVQPFKVSNNDTFKEKVIKGQYAQLTTISYEARDLIDRMLQVEPRNRLTISQILSHPWLSGVNLKYRTSINLFTNAEKILLRKYDVNYLRSGNEELVENFTMKNLDTIIEEERKYGNTRSHILAPYNSYASSISSLSSLDEIKIANGLCRYRGKVKQANLKYELNNNADFDNGVIITQNESSDKGIANEKHTMTNGDSLSKAMWLKNDVNDEINIISGLNSPKNKKRNEIVYDSTEPLTIRENIVREIESTTGYDYSYMINCLKENEVNYATATYHLLNKEFNDSLM